MNERRYRLPAEWELQSAVQLTWPHPGTDWAPILDDVLRVYREMAREIAKRETLIVVAPEGVDVDAGVEAVIMRCPTNDTWARDHAFITLSAEENPRDHCFVDFCFNGWGEKFAASLDNAINGELFRQGVVKGAYRDCLDFVLEGGSIESDGRGTVLTTSHCLMAPHRNQPMTQSQIEQRLKRELGADRILWLDYGLLEGDDTDGHIDTLARLAPNDTILYIYDDGSPELRQMEQQIAGFRTIDGRPYRLLRLPVPRPLFDNEGQQLPATYANFLVVNGAVLCPTYSQPDLDNEALRIIGKAFPDREIVGIDCRPLVWQHGSLHCCTMQYPQ